MLNNVKEAEHIKTLADYIVAATEPVKLYLFGSFAENKATDESDYDFYIVVQDATADTLDMATKAYKALRGKKNRPVDIVVGKESRFEERKAWPLTVESEVYKKGILLYGQ